MVVIENSNSIEMNMKKCAEKKQIKAIKSN